jgi:hypothetical protein
MFSFKGAACHGMDSFNYSYMDSRVNNVKINQVNCI